MKEHIVYNYELIAQKEVVIAEVNSLPVDYCSEPFMSPDLTITINNCGQANAIYDMQPVMFKQYDIIVQVITMLIALLLLGLTFFITLKKKNKN